jgi:hypothetical protein
MPDETRIVAPGPGDRTVHCADGTILTVPANWEFLPPGDAGLTRRIKAAGPTWTIQQKKGRKVFSLGVWAPAARIAAIRAELEAERSTASYAKRRAADKARRARKHSQYVEDFRGAVLAFLDFAPGYAALGERLADAVTQHATPVGSGTVARTERIPIEQRAESAVIAWLRHATTAYDEMKIARVRGKRREVRRLLAEQSRQLLARYRAGDSIAPDCPLRQALSSSDNSHRD